MAGITDIPTEKYLDRQWTLIQACTVMYRFVGNSPQYHPILPSNPFISRSIQVRVIIFSSLQIIANFDMANLAGGALAKKHIWLATCLPRYPHSQISIAKRQTTSAAIKRQPRLGNYEALSRTCAAPCGRTYRSSLLVGQCRYWRWRRIYPQHRLPSKD